MGRVKRYDKPGRPPGAKDTKPRKEPSCITYMEDAGYVTLETAAMLVGVHLSTIFRAARDGLFPSETVGKFRFIHRQHLADYYSAPPIRERIFAYVPQHAFSDEPKDEKEK